MKIIHLLFLILFLLTHLKAQDLSPKFELRGAWIATVANIDWPSKRYATSGEKIKELVEIFDSLQKAHINAVFFQVRTECDAFYESSYEPWSYWLTGKQGERPSPYFDPLEFAISEAHSRGIELHAWFNPYRAAKDTGDYEMFYKHISITHPEWILNFGRYKMLDPGNPDVQNYIINVIVDVLTRYDIDGIHFDDYFYPYLPKITNEDSLTFVRFNRGIINIDNWRRDNINYLIKRIHRIIKEYKPHVKFGVSPFGIVENKYAGTDGFNSYSIIYCDPLTWIKEKSVDYVIPQLYWEIDHPKAPYSKLLPWWSSVIDDRHLYIGLFSSRFMNERALSKGFEIGEQIKMNRSTENVLGSVFFSGRSIFKNQNGFLDSLASNLFKYPALTPPMKWLDSIPPNPPQKISVTKEKFRIILEWSEPEINSQNETAYGYVVYRFINEKEININDGSKIAKILIPPSNKFIDNLTSEIIGEVTYVITSIDRMRNESSGEVIKVVIK